MKICPNCQQANPLQANFCSNCGTSLNVESLRDQLAPQHDGKGKERSAERRQLTILFCDLVGSTSLSEQLDPEEFRQVITSYHKVAEKIVRQYSGHIGQYLGDGLLVYFGYPEGLEDAVKLGIQAGLGILNAIAIANNHWKAEGKTSIKIRIGIHTGLVVVDEHLALGETVNIASRLESLAPHNGLVISPQTLNLAQGWFEVKSIGKHTLKGISEPMEVFQVLHESGAITRLDIAKRKGLSPLVGRQRELEMLTECWEGAKAGNGNVLLLEGEPGIGKSRLVDTIEEQIAQEPDSWLAVARCSAYQSNSSFYPIIEVFENVLMQFEAGDGPEDKLIKLERFLLSSGQDVKTSMSLFAEFLSIPSEQFPPLVVSPIAKRQRIIDGITQVLLQRTIDRPVLFVIEDLHWADASTLEWLNSFIEQISAQAILTLCTTRPSFRPSWPVRSGVTHISLQRLSVENIGDICHYQTKGKVLPKEILKQITAKTEGVPLFVEELTKMILESDLLVEKAECFEVVGSISSMTIPSTLQDSLLARLDRLSNVKEVVQIGAVLGREFSFQMLSAVIPQKEETLELSLSQLLEAEIFYRRGFDKESVYQFKHALIQDAAYESLLKSRRHQLHLQVAAVLEQQFPETVQTQPELLAHHYTEAGHPLQAIPIWLRAGQLASQKNATAEAIAHLEKGLDLLPHIKKKTDRDNLELDFRLTLGGTFVASLGFPHPKVKETFNRARDIAQTTEVSPKLALILFNLLSYYFNIEDYRAQIELSDHMLKLADDPENGYWFKLFATHLGAAAKIIKGEFEQANRDFEDVLEIFNPSLPFPWALAPSGYLEICSRAWKMICLQILGHMDKAKGISDLNLSLSKEHRDSITLYHIYTFPALYSLEAREWKTAEEIMVEYLPIVRAFGDPIFTLTAEVYYFVARAFQGDRTAFEQAVNLVNVCFEVGFKSFAVSLSPYIGEQYFRLGEHESALNWIEKIQDHVNKTGSHIRTAELLRIKGLTLQALGKPDAVVEENIGLALELSRKQSTKTYELRAAGDLARLWQKQGKTDAAYSLIKGIYDWFKDGFDSVDLKEAREILDELGQARNQS
jgi:class 3 adenylate cyclase/tetratricopeptide (TPR) repeat protein